MSKSTRATLLLAKAGVTYTVYSYEYDPSADKIGMAAAAALGEEPQRVLKTLMAEVDGKPVAVIVPSNHEINMKKLAAAFKGKSADMMKPVDAERLTGYVVGGISPFGQKKPVPTVIELSAMSEQLVYINGGQRGLQVRLSPVDVQTTLNALVANVVA